MLGKKKDLEQENIQLQEQVMIAESIIGEYRQALADAQLALARANARLKLSQHPTA